MKRRLGAALLAGAALTVPGAALADTLQEALALTYQTNPTIQSARADLRGVDENVPIEKADGLPDVGATANYVEYIDKASNDFTSPDRGLAAGIDLTVPIYQGGRVKNSIRAAKERVQAGRADLKATESSVFTQTVAAYMDVIRDASVVQLNIQNVDALGVNLQATRDRFEIGDLTRTDVAQSDSRRALAESDLLAARSNLIGSRERYIQLVGQPPENLAPPPPLPNLPASPEEAVAVALVNNPDLIAAKERSQASRYDIEVAGSTRLPSVFAGASTDYNDPLGSSPLPGTNGGRRASQLGVTLSVPLFQGGRPAALERQAQARSASALETEIAVERSVIAQVRSAYSSWQASQETITATTTAVSAASLSLEGVRAENTVGNRTILDILDAERELLSAQVQLVTAQRNAYVAGFSLLAAMGMAEAEDLNFDVGPLYDPVAHYDSVKGSWNDWRFEPDPVAQSTRTVDTPAQNAEISRE
ncbi:TolC family outer membrane protein [Croceicoccus naphthovorans]|uniref:Membrane protein n=1 Tax=Croceicoccus naphthovorans TaxID=1348774 RepID=A0A0G3XI35_9SPHN|nr:TolC family outer membrane protein [Croceicoccus naphthovorans]AKM11220.1 membrane protein [Croceicoccus naphthovorans]MBB3989878.1 outer membrane protein [Croceicoccus naphthovorans]